MDLTDLERFVRMINGQGPKTQGETDMNTTTETTAVETDETETTTLSATGLAARFGVAVPLARGFANFLAGTGIAQTTKADSGGRKGPRTVLYSIPNAVLATVTKNG
jgi:hypothetical protein